MKKSFRLFSCLGLLSVLLTGCRGGSHKHSWADPTYTWSDDYSTCTAERVCAQDSTHKESETANSTYAVVTEPTEESEGLGRYTATFTKTAFATQTHDTLIETFGHDYQFDSFVWTDFTAQAKYVCSYDSSHIEYHEASIKSEVTTSPTCENSGIRTYTATYDGHSDTKTEALSALGHNWGALTYTWASDYSSCTAERVCLNDSSHKETETVNSSYTVVIPATEEEEGLGRYTATFTNSSFAKQTADVAYAYHGQTPILSGDGNTLKYGLYPQKNVNDSTLVSVLNALTTPESNGWYLYDNEYYAKVSATPYDSSYVFDNGTTIVSGTTYWFKCEPITWNVLSNTNGEYYILSSILLDAHRYNAFWHDTDSNERYANNYEYSEIRSWLNNDFYNSAFALGNSYIQTTTVDNSAATTNSSSNSYACNNTQDKVFLPSYQDYINSSYGFTTSTNSTDTRCCRTTDWARARRAYYNLNSSCLYNGYYSTRSPYNLIENYVLFVDFFGRLSNTQIPGSSFSVRPALTIKIA